MIVRDFRASDYGSYTDVHNALFPNHPFFLEREKYEDYCFGRTRYRMKRYLAGSESGTFAAIAELKHLFFSYHPRRFSTSLEVHPKWQNQGIGTMLYDLLLSELSKMPAEVAWVTVLSGDRRSEKFVTDRGFKQKVLQFESALDLSSADLSKITQVTKRLKFDSIVISDLASERAYNKDFGSKLFDLENTADKDVPNITESNAMSYKDYEAIILNNPVFLWEGSFVAKCGDEYVGSSEIIRSGRDEILDHGFTAVKPNFRGKGIAQALKLHVANYARNAGAKFLRTTNDSRNTAMLAVNSKLGFVKRYEWITFEKQL